MKAFTQFVNLTEKSVGSLTDDRVQAADDRLKKIAALAAELHEAVGPLKKELFYGEPGGEIPEEVSLALRRLHYMLGLLDEATEVYEHLFAPTQDPRLILELGDVLWFTVRGATIEGESVYNVIKQVTRKLRARQQKKEMDEIRAKNATPGHKLDKALEKLKKDRNNLRYLLAHADPVVVEDAKGRTNKMTRQIDRLEKRKAAL